MRPLERLAKVEARLREIEAASLSQDQLQRANLIIGVGTVTIFWASLEMCLDYANSMILRFVPGGSALAKELPVALERKLTLFRQGHNLDALAPLRSGAAEIVAETKRLRVQRHDIVHGVAVEMTAGELRYRRLIPEGAELSLAERSFSQDQLTALGNDVHALLTRALAHVERILPVSNPEAFRD